MRENKTLATFSRSFFLLSLQSQTPLPSPVTELLTLEHFSHQNLRVKKNLLLLIEGMENVDTCQAIESIANYSFSHFSKETKEQNKRDIIIYDKDRRERMKKL